jgi:hypothetical protein
LVQSRDGNSHPQLAKKAVNHELLETIWQSIDANNCERTL